MSPEGDQEYFSDGMTEEILNTLAKIQELRVAARTSAFAFKGTTSRPAQRRATARRRYLVEGSVRKAGDQLRITAQLIDASNGSHLWSDTYDRTLDDVFAIQTEIAEAIAEQLRVPLGLEGDEPRHPTADLEAYDLYLAGRAQMRQRGDGLREAIRLFEAAIARDSGWAPAWAALAEAHEIRSGTWTRCERARTTTDRPSSTLPGAAPSGRRDARSNWIRATPRRSWRWAASSGIGPSGRPRRPPTDGRWPSTRTTRRRTSSTRDLMSNMGRMRRGCPRGGAGVGAGSRPDSSRNARLVIDARRPCRRGGGCLHGGPRASARGHARVGDSSGAADGVYRSGTIRPRHSTAWKNTSRATS